MRRKTWSKKIPYHIYWASKGEYGKIRLERFQERLNKRIERGIYNCPRCHGNSKSRYPHTCPFESDMNGNHDAYCYCCASCENNCAGDI